MLTIVNRITIISHIIFSISHFGYSIKTLFYEADKFVIFLLIKLKLIKRIKIIQYINSNTFKDFLKNEVQFTASNNIV